MILQNPIVVLFGGSKIYDKKVKTEGGLYVDANENVLDYPIGTFNNKLIYQKNGFIKSLSNTYLSTKEEPEEAMKSYKGPFEVYQWKDANLFDEHKKDYEKDLN